MSTKLDTRQSINKTALSSAIGSSANEDMSSILTKIDTNMVTADNSKTFTNKSVDDSLNFKQVTTPANPASGRNKFYVKSDGFFYTLDSNGIERQVGSGTSSFINYISPNGDAESGLTTGWTTYADAAGTSPVDGTGGSPTLTFTNTTTAPLRGAHSFLITKDAANRQGEGVSCAFTIDRADLAKVLTISFEYEIGSGTYADNDITVYIYDVTNSLLIQPTPFNLLKIAGQGTFKATFQTSSNSTSYRLLFHVASTSASAYSIKFDSISVKPQQIQYGSPITDWTQYSPTLGWINGISTNTAFYRRVGDSIEVNGYISLSSQPSAALLSIQLPSGLMIDTNKLASTSNNLAVS